MAGDGTFERGLVNAICGKLDDLRIDMDDKLDELTAAAECPTAEQLCQIHVLAALVGKVRPGDVGYQLTDEATVLQIVEIAFNVARQMTLRNQRSLKGNQGCNGAAE
jgi:hypothetical protein